MVKNLPVNPGDTRNSGLILGREEGNGNSLQYPEEPGGLQSMWSQKVRHNYTHTHTHTHTYISGEGRHVAISLSHSPAGVFTV